MIGHRRRVHWAVVAAMVVAVIFPMMLGEGAYAAPAHDGRRESDTAYGVLAKLPVRASMPKSGYKRARFGKSWADVDGNGCSTRNDILARDLTDVTLDSDGCKVLSGKLRDAYTDKTIDFHFGTTSSSKVQIDHVVALSNAWQSGAQRISYDKRLHLANDPYNLFAVDGPSNQRKGDSDAASWLPKNKSFQCQYVVRQIGVKRKYRLSVTQGEHDAMQKVLSSCPTEQVPSTDGVQAH